MPQSHPGVPPASSPVLHGLSGPRTPRRCMQGAPGAAQPRPGTHRRGLPVEAVPAAPLPRRCRCAPGSVRLSVRPSAREGAKPLGVDKGTGGKGSGEEKGFTRHRQPKNNGPVPAAVPNRVRDGTRRRCPIPPAEVKNGSFQNNKLLMLKQL